jgi:hypothetical protein
MEATTSRSDLNRMAAVSDQIRLIAAQGLRMQLHATNARVMTRSTTTRVPGFEVVSEQMRQLSRELGVCLGELRGATVRWLRLVSQRLARERALEVLHRAQLASPIADRAVQPVLRALRAASDDRALATAARRAFTVVLDEARQLAATGCVIARTAKLEATYGGALAVSLAEAASDFTALADSVDEAVRTIARRLTDERWSLP